MKEADRQIIARLNQIHDAQAAGGAASFATLTGSPEDNAALGSALDAKQSEAEVQAIADAKVESEAYGPTWNGDTTHAPAKNDVYAKIEAVVASIPTAPYLVYTALLTQSGTDAPVATVLQNTTGKTFTWSYEGGGEYAVAPDVAFSDLDKVAVDFGVSSQSGASFQPFLRRATSDTSSLKIKTMTATGSGLSDELLFGTKFTIEIYP